MNVAVLGAGYVGLSTGVCLSEIGHHVVCIDVDEQKIRKLNKGVSPIFEPGLDALLANNMGDGRLRFTMSHQEGLEGAEIIIIAVGTPQKDDGGADLTYLEKAVEDISPYLLEDAIVVIKSTVPVGTNEYVKAALNQYCKGVKFDIISNPEFLRQGSAIADTMQADRIVIGYENKEAAKKIQEMYSPLKVSILLTSIKSAEMIKYASNSFLATKISFINEIANLCESVGADIEEVANGMGTDKRIGKSFLRPGIGYGGSCFPKDVKALLHTASQHGFHFSLLKETIAINDTQQTTLINKALKRFGDLSGKKIALLGLAFKPETDDMREAPSIKISRQLTQLGAEVAAFDPVATKNAKKILGNMITFTSSADEAAKNSDAVFIATEWNVFKSLDIARLVKKMNLPIIFDGRNCLDEDRIRECELIEYYPIGRPPIIIERNE